MVTTGPTDKNAAVSWGKLGQASPQLCVPLTLLAA
jgi:hypothetical protein